MLGYRKFDEYPNQQQSMWYEQKMKGWMVEEMERWKRKDASLPVPPSGSSDTQ